jgi:biotin carboxylase
MEKTVLVLGANTYAVRVIEKVRAAGYRALAIDRSELAPGLTVADESAVVDIADRTEVLWLARESGVDAVLAVNDVGVRTAAHVATELGLVGLDPETAERALDKGLMLERWRRDGLPVPDFQVVGTRAEAARAAAAIGFPVVLKPSDSGGGGRGVSIAQGPADIDWSYDLAARFVKGGRMIVQRFATGIELTVEAIAHEGEVHVLAVSDKVKPPLRTRVATTLCYPAALTADARASVESLAREAAWSIGLHNGAVHLELIVGDGQESLIEIGARGGGGHVFSTIVEAVSGVDMVRETARILAGDEPDLSRGPEKACVYRFFVPQQGVITAIRGVEEARRLPGVLDVGVTRQPGDSVGELLDSLERSGFAVVAGEHRREALVRADAVEQAVVFELDPLPAAV